MLKVRFYVDVPEYQTNGYNLYAITSPGGTIFPGFKRLAFDVNMPPEVWKSHDIPAPTTNAEIVKDMP